MTFFIETSPSALPAPGQRSRAVRAAASAARDAAELAELLDMLGLDAREARDARDARAVKKGTTTFAGHASGDDHGGVRSVGEPAVPHVSGQHRLTIAELHALVATVSP